MSWFIDYRSSRNINCSIIKIVTLDVDFAPFGQWFSSCSLDF